MKGRAIVACFCTLAMLAHARANLSGWVSDHHEGGEAARAVWSGSWPSETSAAKPAPSREMAP